MKSFIWIGICLVAFGCMKKGSEDPTLSFRSRKARVVGDWKIVKYESETILGDVVDITDYTITQSQDSPQCDNANYTQTLSYQYDAEIEFKKDMTFNLTYDYQYRNNQQYSDTTTCKNSFNEVQQSETLKGSWQFEESKELLIMNFEQGDQWNNQIIRLANKEMKFQNGAGHEWILEAK